MIKRTMWSRFGVCKQNRSEHSNKNYALYVSFIFLRLYLYRRKRFALSIGLHKVIIFKHVKYIAPNAIIENGAPERYGLGARVGVRVRVCEYIYMCLGIYVAPTCMLSGRAGKKY